MQIEKEVSSMTTEPAHQLAALRRIATFSAALRGHSLAKWRTNENVAHAICVQCGAELRVYLPAFQPAMDGPALEQECVQPMVAGRAA